MAEELLEVVNPSFENTGIMSANCFFYFSVEVGGAKIKFY